MLSDQDAGFENKARVRKLPLQVFTAPDAQKPETEKQNKKETEASLNADNDTYNGLECSQEQIELGLREKEKILEEARKEVAGLTGSIGISLNDRELLSCDSKMIAGMLFGKIKQAEVANLHIELSLHGLFKKTVTPETEWIEAIGILLDNAIEASPKGSTIFLSSKKQGDFLELTVSNPAPPLSNTEFMALFGKGVTTKASRDGHGFGLYNILRMTERYHGKILTRNESILNENYVVFGILMP